VIAVPAYARYRAPSESGQKLAVPPWHEMGELVAANRQWRARADVDLSGRSLADLASQARRELVDRARRYAAAYAGDVGAGFDVDHAPLVLTGHQPGFVHPGVWLKNFAAGALADAHGGAAVHLIVDGDACRTPAILVPAGSVEAPRLESVAFDQATAATPWEERTIVDAATWRSFADRVREAAPQLVRHPMLDDWWPTAAARGEATGRLGASLSQARHLAEIEWGCRNLELPQSQLCQTAAFRHFVAHLLKNLPRFATAYNEALAAYRREHHLRNHAQPVPNLAADGPWLEAPLWLWSAADPRRRAVFARAKDDRVLVSDRHGFEGALPVGETGLDDAVAALAHWEAAGRKLRSRALVTTMFARLALADLFIHGIGGAKYDQATDDIVRRFFGAPPPPFATLSGTLRLPIDHPAANETDLRRLRQRLRELRFHPETHLNVEQLDGAPRAAAAATVAEKRSWLSTPKTPQNAAERHQAIAAANHALQAFLDPERGRIEADLLLQSDRLRASRILNSREFAFCLYPRPLLEQFLLNFAAQAL
jgi:hypothetical protein